MNFKFNNPTDEKILIIRYFGALSLCLKRL
jgi:hypothetical protein